MTTPTKIAGLYCLGRKLGSGSFGDIYFAVNVQTGEEFAVKIESTKASHPQLMYEAKLLKHLQGSPGIARVLHADVEGDYNCMVMELLGPSLEDLFNLSHRKFSLKTVLLIADQMLYRIEYLHSKNFIHRDVKPDNFLVGRAKQANIVYIIDFGLAKKFRDPKTQQHIAYREGKSLTGTARYASTNTHMGFEQSRRDDLEAIGYVLIYFSRGHLPWQGFKASTKEEKYRKIAECKISMSMEKLTKNCHPVFATYMNYCRALRFEDRPDYAYLRRLFKDLFKREGFSPDVVFDWTQSSTSTGDTDEFKSVESSPKGERKASIESGVERKDRPRKEVSHAKTGEDSTVFSREGMRKTDTNCRNLDGTMSRNTTVNSNASYSRANPRSDSPDPSPREGNPEVQETRNQPESTEKNDPTRETKPATPRKQGCFFMSMLQCGSKRPVRE
mmetsp:Transcript_84791/g.133951  ORF Transcript_84791/g.133951 Transcript_84791/m.133951 type:complete len:444 (-) Transcript_84791:90-1421(-)|eukprot:CAMPEP_0169083666 /NCGR_PEP_ID=MMETSP1015-20121227/12199_1 /TAXON_ID=342587 /ORGANISM="Karlodinium micrum, Strain CCMP2283" /LENGTH=443 /DNA_ID=CAMNT_0009143603 /DNA_START=76 /DNA_END=1407 /DNA_ORIENTATION=-